MKKVRADLLVADLLVWDESDQMHLCMGVNSIDQTANNETFLLPMVTVQEIVIKDQTQLLPDLYSFGTEDNKSEEESDSPVFISQVITEERDAGIGMIVQENLDDGKLSDETQND